MRTLRGGSPVAGALLVGAALLAVAACGADGTAAVEAPSPEPPPAAAGRVNADLADTLPTVSTMAQSDAPPPTAVSPGGEAAPEGIEGVVVVAVTSSEHVRHDVEYPTSPPAGGPHLGIWLNCGFYTVPVLDELAVHSLEHGAVWVTYRPEVDAETLAALRVLAAQSSHLLVSPYEAQEAPLVMSAWGRQLRLESREDPRFARFLEVYLIDGPTTPEPGAACSGAVGVPPEHPEAIPEQG
ncbi:MAG: DUF3105 domain-containing protein [Acidimicrobiia bacterium]|nr:DUF3105 domain-containing protein [Acidimicrobiia bacterium]MYB24558.1 DUF3105 domain-containing protein [Acidimicrobiia bacterium]